MIQEKVIAANKLHDWLAEVEAVRGFKSDAGLTVRELAEQLGKSEPVVREILRKLNAIGRVKVGRRTTTRIDGRSDQVPVYSLKRK